MLEQDGDLVGRIAPSGEGLVHRWTVIVGRDAVVRVFGAGGRSEVFLNRLGNDSTERCDAIDAARVGDALVFLAPDGRAVVAGDFRHALPRPATRLEPLDGRRFAALDDDSTVAVLECTDAGFAVRIPTKWDTRSESSGTPSERSDAGAFVQYVTPRCWASRSWFSAVTALTA